jgi:hypothetical protein
MLIVAHDQNDVRINIGELLAESVQRALIALMATAPHVNGHFLVKILLVSPKLDQLGKSIEAATEGMLRVPTVIRGTQIPTFG